MPLPADLEFVIALAREAAALVRNRAGTVERLSKRNGAEAVSEADRASQRLIVAGLRARFPDDGFIGEESDAGDLITNLPPRAGRRVWVIDPIDGTNNFLAGLGNYAVCIGLLDAGMPVLGVVHDVARDQVLAAARGAGAWCDGRRLSAPATPLFDGAILMLTSNLLIGGRLPDFVQRWLTETVWKVRMLGSAALECAMVGAGVAHGAITINGKLWDVAAPAAVALEAGALITGLDGQPVFPFDLAGYSGGKVPFVCAGPAAHGQLLEEINRPG
jgi:myo-inositol-1(or 4)-monophosphatase